MSRNERCKFLFDIVVTRYVLTKLKVSNPKYLIVEAKFENRIVKITSSRQNVTDFKPKTSIEINQKPSRLRFILESCGMPVVVKYRDQVIGSGQINFPSSVLEQIKEGMSDLLHSDSSNIEYGGETIGTVDVHFRLVIKCPNPPLEELQGCVQNIDRSINPQDIMFIMGDNQRCPKPCQACPDILQPEDDADEDGDDRVQLDLARYKGINKQWTAQDVFMQDPARKSICCELKQMSRDCEEIVDSVTAQTKAQSGCISSGPQQTADDFLFQRTVNSCFGYLPNQQTQGDNDPYAIAVPISDIGQPSIKPSRFCPVCLTNMSWLPKFAACPKCGVKPMPMLEERHREKRLTAEQILLDYLGKPLDMLVDPCKTNDKDEAQQKEKQNKPECRCTCKFGKICAHCRIRKLCADVFQSDEKKCRAEEPENSEDYCTIIENKEKCRPYLSRVFSELRDLYNVKEVKVQAPQQKICGKFKRIRSSHDSRSVSSKTEITSKKIQIKVDPPAKPKLTPVVSLKVLGRKKSRLGHKHCVHQPTAVSKHHGWDWQSTPESRKYGWRPGYILKPIKRLMNFFLQHKPQENAIKVCKRLEAEDQQKQKNRQPILNVCKKNGEIHITLRGVNDPNVQMKPITFKIVKSDQAVALRQIKRKLKQRGFRKCICHKTLMLCECRNYKEKQQLGCALQRECRRRGMESLVDQLVLTDTSDSEMEYDIDVSPPVASVKPQRRLPKRGHRNNSTQTVTKKAIANTVKPMYPKPHPGFYWRTYDCAAGDRYRSPAFGAPGEQVFEDGVFGYRGGGAHGAAAASRGRQRSERIPQVPGGRQHVGGPSKAIPVRLPQRMIRAAEQVERARREEAEKAEKKRKEGIDMAKYLKNHKVKQVIGPDGLTDAQRRRLALRQVPSPSIEHVPHRGQGFDPCAMQCSEWCNPFGYDY